MTLITLIAVMLLLVRMNFNSENAVVEYWEFKNKEDRKALIKKWHRYDAIVRVVIIPYIVYLNGFNILETFILSITILFFWMVLFNISWNVKRAKNECGKPDYFYLGDYAVTDLMIKKLNSKIELLFSKIFRKDFSINYRVTNAILQLAGLIILPLIIITVI